VLSLPLCVLSQVVVPPAEMICVDAGSAHLCMEAMNGLRIARQIATEIAVARLNQHSLTHITAAKCIIALKGAC